MYSCDGKTWKTITPLDGDKWLSFYFFYCNREYTKRFTWQYSSQQI